MILRVFVIYFLSVVIMMSIGLLVSIALNIKASIALSVPFITSLTLGLSSMRYASFSVIIDKMLAVALVSLFVTCIYLASHRLHLKGAVSVEDR